MMGENETGPAEVGWTGAKQPNFLQKLYDFLNLDPHPCPNIIYWASDSRQLVIAQPDRLVQEVLPKLFKHDKLSSFGRQLNIYGFSRLFPGRQFKDSEGKVSDASVWAHPTLDRLSTPDDVASVKRRAAPKLFRTRRLANGQVVRSRAGPAVEAKFRQVRESIAESRRHRGSVSVTDGQSPSSTDMDEYDHEPSISVTPAPRMSIEGGSFGRGMSRLQDIVEGQEQHVISPSYMMDEDTSYNRRDSAMSFDQLFGTSPSQSPQGDQNGLNLAGMPLSPMTPMAPLTPLTAGYADQTELDRQLRSCPASVHTSPVASKTTAPPNQGARQWSAFFSQNASAVGNVAPSYSQQAQDALHQEMAIGTGLDGNGKYNANSDLIAQSQPQTPMSGVNPLHPDPINTTTMPSIPGTFAQAMGTLQPSYQTWQSPPPAPLGAFTPSSVNSNVSMGGAGPQSSSSWLSQVPAMISNDINMSLQHSWDTHGPPNPMPMVISPPETIDPRWVSPLSSLWSTPAGTPRMGSPVEGTFQGFDQLTGSNGQSLVPMAPKFLSTNALYYTPPTPLTADYRHAQTLPQDMEMFAHTHNNALPDQMFVQQQGTNNVAPQHPGQGQGVVFGTQSFPPRLAELRQREAQHKPIYHEPQDDVPEVTFSGLVMNGLRMDPGSYL